jgi:hypothetical protein
VGHAHDTVRCAAAVPCSGRAGHRGASPACDGSYVCVKHEGDGIDGEGRALQVGGVDGLNGAWSASKVSVSVGSEGRKVVV